MNKHAFPLLVGLMAACLAAPASANYSQIVAFGDSLSDNGNLFHLIGQPPAPYVNGRFSNGPVAVEVMAQTLGLGLTDFAFGGAKTGMGSHISDALNGTGVAGQIAKYGMLTGGHADASALYMVWAGPNDFFSGMTDLSTPTTASNNLLNDVTALYNMGARDFFVPLMPNLGVTPMALGVNQTSPGFAALASFQSLQFNSLLSNGLNQLQQNLAGIQIRTFDTSGFLATQIAIMNGQAGKVTNLPCFDSTKKTVCANPDDYLFWDGVHPTAAAHNILGHAFAAAVPEPETYALALAGLVIAVAARRRSVKTAA